MLNLRSLAENDLSITLEGEYGMEISLISPDGVRQDDIRGQILYDTVRLNPETGERVVTNQPIVSLRRASLTRIPVPGETWVAIFPTSPVAGAPLANFSLSPVRPPEGGGSIGFIRLYFQMLEQIEAEE